MPDHQSPNILPSEYEPLDKPECKPSIPAFLLDGASDQDKYIMSTLSFLSQHAEWSTQAHLRTHEELRYTNGKVRHNKAVNDRLEEDVKSLKDQATAVSPFLKVLSYVSALWEYRVFRWLFWLAIAFIALVLYPAYISHPISDWSAFAKRLVGLE